MAIVEQYKASWAYGIEPKSTFSTEWVDLFRGIEI